MPSIKSPIDLVNLGPFSLFMYEHDYTYNLVPNHLKNYSIQQHIKDLKTGFKSQSEILWRNPFVKDTELILNKIIDYNWKHNEKFSIVDVGCQYGTLSMMLAHHIKQFHHNNVIFSFDCGIAGLLAKNNILLNQLQDIIHFEYKAVSNSNLPQLVFYDENFSGDNHIVKRKGNTLPNYMVDGITLDSYFENFEEDLLIKIDTQGAEPLVFKGMKKILDKKHPPILFEFVPSAYQLIQEPVDFLYSLPDGYHILNQNEKNHRLQRILQGEFETFVRDISSTKPYWTDIVLVHESISEFDELINELTNPLYSYF